VNILHVQASYKTTQFIVKNLQLIFVLLVSFFLIFNTVQAKDLSELSAKDQLDKLIEQHHGQVIYVDFWAFWCGPCRKSFPWMNKIQSELKSQGFTVISINVDAE